MTLLVSVVESYQWKDQNDYNLNIEFANGGVKEGQNAYNTTTVIGGSFVSFNSSGLNYNIYQGMLYIIWSNVNLGLDIISPTVNCSIIYRGIEWGEINCSTTETVTWSMSIIDNETQERYLIFDTRSEGQRKFIGLKEGKEYVIEVNATDDVGNIGTETTVLKTKLAGEKKDMILALLLIPLGLCFLFIYIGNSLNEEQEPLKWFFRLLALVMVFVVYTGAHMAVAIEDDYSNLAALFDIETFGYIFWSVLAFFFVFIIYKIFKAMKQKKQDEFDRGII